MNKAFVIIKREYLQRVRTRAFLIGTIATPVFMLAVTVLPILLAGKTGGERKLIVLDQSGDPGLYGAVQKQVASRTLGTRFSLTQIAVEPDQNIEEVTKERTSEAYQNSELAFLVLRPGILDGVEPEYYAKNTGDFSIQGVGRGVSVAVTQRRLVRAGFDASKIEQYMKPVEMKTLKVTASGVTEEGGQTAIVAFVMLFFIYMTVLIYGISVMRGVIEEKQSRIVEVVVSSVKPFPMMMGKLIGIGMVGLTQYTIWVVSAVVLTTAGAARFSSGGFQLPPLPLSLLIYFVVYFVLGYFLFATLYTIVGAMVSSEEDAQQMQFPVTMLMVVPMMIFWMIMRDPNGTFSTVMSLVPFFTPTLMMLRIAVVSPPLWQILLSMALMLATIVGVVWVAGRIYRVGILMYGKKPNLIELGRWLRYS